MSSFVRLPFRKRPQQQETVWPLVLQDIVFNIAALIIIGFLAVAIFGSDEIAGQYVLIPFSYVMSLLALALPLGFVLAFIRRTKSLAGIVIYLNSVAVLLYLWMFAFLLLYQHVGKWWAFIGALLAVFSGGYGLFVLFVIAYLVSGHWLIAIGFTVGILLCGWAKTWGVTLMFHAFDDSEVLYPAPPPPPSFDNDLSTYSNEP